MAITIQNGSIVVRDGQVGTQQACCCVIIGCCGIPKNCTVTVSAQSEWVYDHATGAWDDGNGNQWAIEFGDCVGDIAGLGDEYSSCCLSLVFSATPGAANPADPCFLFSARVVGRIVCDACCNAEPEFGGDENEYGVNCRIEGVLTDFFQIGDCSAVRGIINFDNWDITINCDPEPDPCNPLP